MWPRPRTLTLTNPPAGAVRTLIELVAKVPGAGKVRAPPSPHPSPPPPDFLLSGLHGVGVSTHEESIPEWVSREAGADPAVHRHSGVVSPGEAFLPPPSHPGQACLHVQYYPPPPFNENAFFKKAPTGSGKCISCFCAPYCFFALKPVRRFLSRMGVF